jgi:uncharacterized protein YjbI with pentapeptide repeats
MLLFVPNLQGDFPDKGFSRYVYQRTVDMELQDGIDLSYKYLPDASFTRALGDLRDINFTQADLQHSDFSETTYINCNFTRAKMRGVESLDAAFVNCDFTDADITGATFELLSSENIKQTRNYKKRMLANTKIMHCDFGGELDLSNFDLENAVLPKGVVSYDFTDARIKGVSVIGVAFDYISPPDKIKKSPSFTKEHLYTTKDYKSGAIIGVTFCLVDFRNVNFLNMNLSGCTFSKLYYGSGDTSSGCDFKNADLTDAVISNCDFTDTMNLTLAQIKSTWNYKVGRMDGIELPKSIQDELDKEKENKTK